MGLAGILLCKQNFVTSASTSLVGVGVLHDESWELVDMPTNVFCESWLRFSITKTLYHPNSLIQGRLVLRHMYIVLPPGSTEEYAIGNDGRNKRSLIGFGVCQYFSF